MKNWKEQINKALKHPEGQQQLHLIKQQLIDKLGFHEGYRYWIKTILDSNISKHPVLELQSYFERNHFSYFEFVKHEYFLLKTIKNNNQNELINWINQQAAKGMSTQKLYYILLCAHLYWNSLSETGEVYADWLADNILDQFTSWAKGNRILPNQPDIS
ncbi:MAG: hypothetical protein GY810_22805 [Aureispira sp.]|nr:hypothetical protein [Aureispira sp.]